MREQGRHVEDCCSEGPGGGLGKELLASYLPSQAIRVKT